MAPHFRFASASQHRVTRLLLCIALRGLTAAGLTLDAVIHLRLASDRDTIGTALSEGNLFRIEAAAAFVAALLVLALPWRRAAYGVGLVVAASALGAVMLYRYVDVGAIGPLPDMYEPIWYGEKSLSALAELVATITAAVGFAGIWWRRRREQLRSPAAAPDGIS